VKGLDIPKVRKAVRFCPREEGRSISRGHGGDQLSPGCQAQLPPLLAPVHAESKREIGKRGLIRAGIRESQLNQEIYSLAKQIYRTTTYWHKRIVRAGGNTCCHMPRIRRIKRLLGMTFCFSIWSRCLKEWEADLGRTFVIGDDPAKEKLRLDTDELSQRGKSHVQENLAITACELFEYIVQLAKNSGWEFGGPMPGHLIGQFHLGEVFRTITPHKLRPSQLRIPHNLLSAAY